MKFRGPNVRGLTTKKLILDRATDWMRPSEIADGTGLTSKTVSAVCHSLMAEGKLESVFFDGRGTCYRAVPGASAIVPPDVMGPALEALGDREMTVREVARAAGIETDRVRASLKRAEKHGLVERVGETWPIVWRKTA